MCGFVSVPPVISQTYKATSINRIPWRHRNFVVTLNKLRLPPRFEYLRQARCTVTTERPSLKREITREPSSYSNENTLDSFLAEKGYKVEDSVILFDGECNLCNGSVNFVLDHDKDEIFKFAALQSPVGVALLQKYDGPMDMSSLVLIEKGRLLLKSDAILRIAELLDNQILCVLAVATRWGFPRWLRDWVYTEIISKYRRQIFGETDSCRLMEPGWEHRFL
ncbi:DCC family protein, chloroplastic [Galdieria sulphuraria]|uniref:Thiol-disulfide oxidoreductase DCC n=1 Tax=Galdieria sulphuraria TaxID=130081 RepID=M2XXM0_GALSU|nr:uncharacterized protein Gasu_41920 [Galdieria sulphuraria]EME28353.1 hypothetical protein Gasu_41920 [Galdieria sulphuraria]GJD12536.1 DCC family protein, chloroplastic [Galdieria sulphuraria]|eukprot:XP_005704873.1 hypothetical protein Gasu_41920 [Galdieria sulphuraria]